MEDLLSDEKLGADTFNKSLEDFWGRNDLRLGFNKDKKGYEILRDGSEKVDGYLSEGEKTAISFVYFITKLEEKGNQISDTIVVVDDPVSSFDSNNLYYASNFIQVHCKKAKQLFVLTHNFQFFKLIRDWIKRIQKKSLLYVVEVSKIKENRRISIYKDAEDALKSYNSEYHYIFSKLYSLKEKNELCLDNLFNANLARKLLELFLSFKFPSQSDLRKMIEVIKYKYPNIEPEKIKAIQKFVNDRSHALSILENSDPLLSDEFFRVISGIFDLIQALDETHYKEMKQIVVSKEGCKPCAGK